VLSNLDPPGGNAIMKMRRSLAPKSVSNEFLSSIPEAVSSLEAVSLEAVSLEAVPPRWQATLLVGAVAALLLGACVDDVDPAPSVASGAGSAGMTATVVGNGGTASSTPGGNTSGSGGVSAGAGAGAYTSDPTFGMGVHCPTLTQALLTDFTYAAAASADAGADGGLDAGATAALNPTGTTFGDFTSTFSGSTFVYPGAGPYAVNSDVTGNNWHMTGSLGDYSGFGIVFVGCAALNASAYKGISFTVQGSVPMGGTITFSVNSAADDISHVWLNAVVKPTPAALVNAGRCIPAAMQYDGTCTAPSRSIPVTAERTTINVLWADLAGVRPSAAIDPTEITNLSWNFPPPAGAGTTTPTTYDVDLTIDDLQFIAP
jgi:hypothetical protein